MKIFVVFSIVFCSMIACAQDRYKKFLDSLITVLPLQKEDSTKASVLMHIARLKMGEAQNNGKWEDAIDRWSRALNFSTKVNYQFGIGRSNIMLGKCWSFKGNFAEATKYFYAALRLSLQNENKVLKVAATHNLGMAYRELGNYHEALKNYLLSYETVQQLNDKAPVTLQQLAKEIAEVYIKLSNFPEALKWCHKALPENPQFFYEGAVTLLLASVQMEMKQYDEALKNLRAAVHIFPARFNRKQIINTKGVYGEFLMEYGEAFFKIGRLTHGSESIAAYQQAIEQLKKSIPLLEDGAGGKEAQLKAYSLLSEASEALNDHSNALKYTKLYMGLKDSMYNKQTYVNLSDIKVKHETEKAVLAMNAQREKEQLKETALRERLLADERLQQEKLILQEKFAHEKEMAAQRLQKETAIAQEKSRHEKAITLEKSKQELMQAEKERVNNLLLMGLVLVVITSVFCILFIRQRQSKKRTIEKAEAIHRMTELELQSLRSQLNPHFMFNSLNSIQELILLEENDKSHSYLARFSKLLRMLLENAEKPFIPLQKELDFLQLYLGLENLRVPDLQYSISTDPSVNTEETLIPNMILQPYIENAIWHGLSHKASDKQLQIRIFRENGAVNYEIEDNGVGRKKAAELKSFFRQKHKSKGMELLSKRFKLLNKEYSSEITTTITDIIKNNEAAGTLVTIKVPVNDYAPLYN